MSLQDTYYRVSSSRMPILCPLGTTNCRIVSEASLPTTIQSFFFVVGLVLVCNLISAPVTNIVFASYHVLVALSMVLHAKSGSRRLQLWEVIAKVDLLSLSPSSSPHSLSLSSLFFCCLSLSLCVSSLVHTVLSFLSSLFCLSLFSYFSVLPCSLSLSRLSSLFSLPPTLSLPALPLSLTQLISLD
jgi:hypothetical protein